MLNSLLRNISPIQSTHLREVRLRVQMTNISGWHFNPRTCVRCDTYINAFVEWLKISIHAPAWGATLVMFLKNKSIRFQSTHLREVRRPLSLRIRSVAKFQSTHLREVRLCIQDLGGGNEDFNPRTCVRCDRIWLKTDVGVSLRALLCEAAFFFVFWCMLSLLDLTPFLVLT